MRKRKNNPILPASFRTLAAVLLLTAALAPSGCLSVKTNLLDVQTSAKPMEKTEYEVIGNSEGQHSEFRLFWLFPVTPRASRDKAIEEAVAVKGGDNLIFVRMWYEKQIWILGTINIIHVRGQAVRYKDK